jgi:hypothetical protein
MRSSRFAAALALCLTAAATTPVAAGSWGGEKAFEFVALGDMPYKVPDDVPRFDRLIAKVNELKPAFTIHVGDTKSGSTSCADSELQRIYDQLQTFEGPLVYTPGDNEWTDCHREKAGKFDPLERLAKVREMFFKGPGSLGRAPIDLTRQGDVAAEHRPFVENARWTQGGVMFATVHVVGSNNNLLAKKAMADEYFARNAAGVAWIKDSFAEAAKAGAAAVVIAMQADMFYLSELRPVINTDGNGFVDTVKAISSAAEAFGKPVLVINGDTHLLRIDQPFFYSDGKTPLESITRLQVMGEGRVHAVRVLVDPDAGNVFSFQPLMAPENLNKPTPKG